MWPFSPWVAIFPNVAIAALQHSLLSSLIILGDLRAMSSSILEARASQHEHRTPYGYTPTLWICALFIALFGLSTIIHIGQALRYRLWWLLPTIALAGTGEVIGWSARLWSNKNVTLLDPYLIQITTTIISPTPLIAANFIILGQLISRLGSRFSRLPPLLYTVIFCTCDIVALVIQAVGGAKASIAVKNDEDPNPGGNVMLAGIAFQMASITIYMTLAAEFVLRYLWNKPFNRANAQTGGNYPFDMKLKLMLSALMFSSLTIFIRSVYRTVELTNGFAGTVIHTQVLFNVLDGGMVTLAIYTMNFLHPGVLLGTAHEWKEATSYAMKTVEPEDGPATRNSTASTMRIESPTLKHVNQGDYAAVNPEPHNHLAEKAPSIRDT